MKRITFLILCLGLFLETFAQQNNQVEKVDSVVNLLFKYWKEKDVDEMYSLGGENFKKQYTAQTFKEVWNDQMFKIGNLTEKKLLNSTEGINKYKLVFDAITFSFKASLDKQNKFDVFLFELYKDDSAKRQTKIISDNKLQTALDRQVDSIMQQYFSDTATTGASIGILINGKSFLYNYGETVRGNKQLPTFKTIYEIGSITKTFTSALLAMAAWEGRIKLDDPVNKYLPDEIPPLQFNGKAITLQSLANHSSGLPYMPSNLNTNEYNIFKDYDDKTLFEFLKQFKLSRETGQQFEYSNVAFGLLGIILERIYKKSFEQLVKDKITVPLKMPYTSQHILTMYKSFYAQGHDDTGHPNEGWDFNSISGAGALHSNVADLLKYASANMYTNNISLQNAFTLTHKTTFKNATQEVGLGWHKLPLKSYKVLLHTGGTGGFKSCIAIIPEKRLAVIALSNQLTDIQKEGLSILEKLF